MTTTEKTVNTATVGAVVRRAVGEYQYRTRGARDFVVGMEVVARGTAVAARFVNFSGLADSYIDNKEQLLYQSHSALIDAGYTTTREGDTIIVAKN